MPRERKNLKIKNNAIADGDEPPVKPKKRRSSNAASAAAQSANANANSNANNSNSNQTLELIPPQPLSSYGDTIIASNPFDDTPQSQSRPPNASTPSGGPPPSVGSMHGPPTPGTPLPQMQQPQPQPKPVPLMSGKIYPSDQSMVFNPANPNAPPIYPCGICHKEVHDNDQAILCESGCNFWFHRICTGITERAYYLLTKEVYAEWVCDKCLNNKQIPLVKFKP